MDYNDKTAVTVGANSKHKFPMQPMHLTTSKFMHFDIAFAKELPPHSNKVVHKTFLRTMPLKKPLLSSIMFHKSAYFVPFRTVWEPFTDFKEESPHVQQNGAAILNNVPLISNKTLLDVFTTLANGFVRDVTGTSDVPDFVTTIIEQGQGVSHSFQWTAKGRDAYKLLISLGYRCYFDIYNSSIADRTTSALPLLCAAKVYLDYFFPNQYAHTGYYINLDGIFKRQYVYTMSSQDLLSVFEICRFVSYNSDYFVSAFDNFNGPTSGTVSNGYQIRDISTFTVGNNQTYTGQLYIENNQYTNDVPTVYQDDPDNTVVMTQYMDTMLKRLNNYIMRHGLSGSRSLERYLADWGVTLSADKLQRCYKLGEKHYPLQISDIVSSADTIQEVAGEVTGAALGDLAGKGVAFNGDFNCDYDFDEFGYFMVINTIIPEVSYYQGIDKNVLHKTRLDFLTGDFDGVTNRPIASEELFVGQFRASKGYDRIFGFCPMYAEYKTAVDRVSGDFLLNSVNVGLEGWSTLREFSDKYTDQLFELTHSINFVLGNDWEQFNRIFLDSNDDSDKFVVLHRCEMTPIMPAAPLYDYYEFGDGKDKIKLSVNGSKSN